MKVVLKVDDYAALKVRSRGRTVRSDLVPNPQFRLSLRSDGQSTFSSWTYHPKLWEPELIFENDTSGFMTNLWLILESIGII